MAPLAGSAHASLITNGFTFAVASGGDQDTGTHFHPNTGGAFGNPAGKAEVGRFFGEEVRGLSEYNLAGLTTAASAFVTFTVFKQAGLFAGQNDTPFTGGIKLDAYVGNNTEDISDFQAASIGAVGSFNVDAVALTPALGDVLSFDITSIFNAAITASDASLGIRLVEDRLNAQYPDSKAWTFQDFRLTTDNQSTNRTPEPGSMALVALALFGLGALTRRRQV